MQEVSFFANLTFQLNGLIELEVRTFYCLIISGRPNRSGTGSGSAELSGSVRFGGSAEPRGSVNRTKTEPKHCINPIFY